MTKQDFIKKALDNNVNISKYDYILVPDKIVSKQEIEIKCIKHNCNFKQLVQNHIKGFEGCKICNSLKQSKSRTKTTEQFIKEAKSVWNNKNNYNNVIYTEADKPAQNIFCNIHNIYFNQNANQHLRGHEGCELCKSQNRSEFQRKPIKNFIEEANKVWNKLNLILNTDYKFDYSETNYIHSQTDKIKIKCLKHNIIFEQRPHGHLQAHIGCPICKQEFNSSSKEQEIIQFLKQYYFGEIVQNYRNNSLGITEIDIYLPELKIGIEFNGLYWHSTEFKSRNYHIQKTINCEKNNIRLIHIFEDEWVLKKNIVKSRLLHILKLTPKDSNHRIFARKLKLKQITNSIEERLFLEANHLQGYVQSKICYGLYYYSKKQNKDILVSLMSFGKPRFDSNYGWELLRFCNTKFCSIPFAAQRLFQKFIKTIKPKSIISYADRRWSQDISSNYNKPNVYNQLGFKFQGYQNNDLGFYYFNGLKRYNRSIGRKEKRNGLTEQQWMEENNYLKIYDCGQLKYVYIL